MSAGLSLGARDLRRAFRTGFSVEVGTLDVGAGRSLALLGPSGSGKSTLLLMLGLLERPDAGTVLLDGRPVDSRDVASRRDMAAVFQRPYLIKGTVAGNVEYGLKLRNVPAEERRARVDRVLERVGLAGFGGRSAATLSGGEAQRVALARALVLEPRVLLLDEPLASLDPLLKRRVTGEFARILRDEGVTVVYVTHDHDEALVVADDIAVMNAGRIVAHGPAPEVMALPADPWTAEFLGMEVPGSGEVVASADGLVTIACGAAAGGVSIAAVGAQEPGTRVLFSVAPEDVVLAPGGADLGPTSARNVLHGRVERVEARGATWRVAIGIGDVPGGCVTISSSVSHAALDELRLEPGSSVQAIFKATAVRVRTADA